MFTAISLGALHGYGTLLRIQQTSGERLEILQGSLDTAIYRLERRAGSRRAGESPATAKVSADYDGKVMM